MILTKYKNQLLGLIQEYGLETRLFNAGNGKIDKDSYFIVTLRDSPVRFGVQPYQDFLDSFTTRYSLFRTGFPMNSPTSNLSESGLTNTFNAWLTVVTRYLQDANTPDLWQILEESRSRAKSELGTPEDFDSFSDQEKTQIGLSLNEFRLLVAQSFNPNQEELETLDARLEYLSNATDKHNRFDWRGIAFSTVISISIALSLSPEQGTQLFQLFQRVFSNILYLLP